MKKIIALLLFTLFLSILGEAQTTNNSRENALKIFLDCNFCDLSHIKKEISFVNYVRDTKEAQVHILVTRQSAGSGGQEYTFTFLGQLNFQGTNDTLSFVSQADNTSNEIRANQVRVLQLGLVYYIAHTENSKLLTIGYSEKNKPSDEIVEDKWNSWVFSLGASGYFNGDSNYSYINANGNASAEKVTEKQKIELAVNYNHSQSTFIIDNVPYITLNKSSFFEYLQVWSINNHWSAGVNAFISSSSYSNKKVAFSGFPAIEYNLFPYSESTRRQLRFLLKTGYVYNFYNTTTIYNKTEEGLFKERLSISYETSKKWGTINSSLAGSLYLHDLSKNNLSLYTSVRIRIIKGLSLRLSSNISLIHDQLYLPLEGASRDEILLRQNQLSTQYSYWGSVGLTYTFGSIYNNIVNPRFGD